MSDTGIAFQEQHHPRPAWQTEELADEWIEEEEEEEATTSHVGTERIATTQGGSLRNLGGSINYGTRRERRLSTEGTFLLREDVPASPLLPKTPSRGVGGGMKDFFSPLALEKMFEPPSPPKSPATGPGVNTPAPQHQPARPSKLSQVIGASFFEEGEENEAEGGGDNDEIVETDIPNIGAFDGRKPSSRCQFTFTVPRASQLAAPNNPQAQSTPIPQGQPQPQTHPLSDPRLRLFQFQYDTYTREHLSAIVDSIGVNTPSNHSSSTHLTGLSVAARNSASPSPAADEGERSFAHLRSTKRIKLSPPSDFVTAGRTVASGESPQPPRPKLIRDYVGESRSLMQQIKMARVASTASVESPTVHQREDASARPPRSAAPEPRQVLLQLPEPNSTRRSPSGASKASKYTSLAYRRQAADLMALIKKDVKTSKRIFSDPSEKSFSSQKEVERDQIPGRSRSPSPEPKRKRRAEEFGKENDRRRALQSSSSVRLQNASLMVLAKQKASPRKILRRISAADEVDRELELDKSYSSGSGVEPAHLPPETPEGHTPGVGIGARVRSPNAAFLAPPTHVDPNEDLKRFVSSSTTATNATTGTTLTAGSGASFVKHAGPVQMVRIAPGDVPALPDRVGRMEYDRALMRWVKRREGGGEVPAQQRQQQQPVVEEGDGESEDPFQDIESLDDSGTRGNRADGEGSVDMEMDDEPSSTDEETEGEGELATFSFAGPAAGVVHVMTGDTDTEDETTDSDDEEDEEVGGESDVGEQLSIMTTSMTIGSPHTAPQLHTANPLATPYAPRSALKSTSVTPVTTRPRGSGHRRSVSFSDGRKDGKIRGLDVRRHAGGAGEGEAMRRVHPLQLEGPDAVPPAAFVPSVRSHRIAEMLDGLAEPSDTTDSDESPSKGGGHGAGRAGAPSLQHWHAVEKSGGAVARSSPRRALARARTRQHAAGSRSASSRHANATFLTECSFGVAHDRLVQVITDVQPFEPHWEGLAAIDLSGRKVDSVARLKEFLPQLDTLTLNNNLLSWLSGVPGSVRTLSVASNALTSLTSFAHLVHLERVDISENDIDSLHQLGSLRHLRELRADGNKITSVEGLGHLEGLVKLSLQGNLLRDVDFTECRWRRLEMLNLSHNRLDQLSGLGSLQGLMELNIDNNALSELDGALGKLRVLRVSGNKLGRLDVGGFPGLRTLYVDNNGLGGGERVVNLEKLGRLENVSVRNQSGGGARERGLHLESRDVRDVRRLYLSGNPSPLRLSGQACYNVVYLELAGCRLTELPGKFAEEIPNVRVLNLNYNFLDGEEIVRGLGGLKRLRKLTIVGGRLRGTKGVIRMLSGMEDMEMVDLRMNPCTLGWYLPLLVQDVPGALGPSGGGGTWGMLDKQFRRDLPDDVYVGRLVYRGLVMRACPRVLSLDGVAVSVKERVKAEGLLRGVVDS